MKPDNLNYLSLPNKLLKAIDPIKRDIIDSLKVGVTAQREVARHLSRIHEQFMSCTSLELGSRNPGEVFLEYGQEEFGIERATAYNYLNVAKHLDRLAEFPTTFSNLVLLAKLDGDLPRFLEKHHSKITSNLSWRKLREMIDVFQNKVAMLPVVALGPKRSLTETVAPSCVTYDELARREPIDDSIDNAELDYEKEQGAEASDIGCGPSETSSPVSLKDIDIDALSDEQFKKMARRFNETKKRAVLSIAYEMIKDADKNDYQDFPFSGKLLDLYRIVDRWYSHNHSSRRYDLAALSIRDFIEITPGTTRKEIADARLESEFGVSRVIESLLEEGKIRADKGSTPFRYYAVRRTDSRTALP